MRCPFKFSGTPRPEFITLEGKAKEDYILSFCQCDGSKCEFWTTMYTTELVQVSGCAIRMIAMKNSEGNIVV